MYVCTKISLYFQIEANGDILAEMILDDIIRDTAAELENLEIMERAEREAIRLQDNPTLENVFQRLEQMEVCSHHSGAQNFIFQDLYYMYMYYPFLSYWIDRNWTWWVFLLSNLS